MAMMDTSQTISIAVSRSYRNLRTRLQASLTLLTGFSAFLPKQIVIAPHDLNTADPLMAEDFYRGKYVLGGVLVVTGGASPFSVTDAPASWKEKLHGFGWLRHLAAREDNLSASHARAMITDWMEMSGAGHGEFAWRIDIVSRRLIAWLCHSDMILNSPGHEFYAQFRRSLAMHVRYLKRHATAIANSEIRALAYIALAYASVCHDNQHNSLSFARTCLAEELDRQILSDGGHVSRNPSVIIDFLALILPFRQACLAVGASVPVALNLAVERMLPAVRFFRMGDGTIARFNGSKQFANNLPTTLLRYDETAGQPLLNASNSGYQRLAVGESIVLMDTGKPPKGELSVNAHASCLAFEFSSGTDCIVVNCGAPVNSNYADARVWRSSAAHSTIVLCETSCCRFENSGPQGNKLSGQILANRMKPECKREDSPNGSAIVAAHSGYVREFGVRVVRRMILANDGKVLRGSDLMTAPDGGPLRNLIRDHTTLHFHLHPDVKVAPDLQGDYSCIIETRSGQRWRFTCEEVPPQIEESIFFATSSGTPRACFQIVVNFEASVSPEANWVFQRIF